MLNKQSPRKRVQIKPLCQDSKAKDPSKSLLMIQKVINLAV